MKKLLILVVVSLAFTGFTNKEETKLDSIPISSNRSQQKLPPKIGAAEPATLRVVAIKGDRIKFSIAYISEGKAEASVTKGEGYLGENCSVTNENGEVIVTILNIKEEDAGIYTITVSNEFGSSTIRFSIHVAPALLS